MHEGICIHAIYNMPDIVLNELATILFGRHNQMVKNVWTKLYSDQQVIDSKGTKSHARAKLSDKEFSAIVEANEPLKVLLKHTLTSDSMLGHDSIQARLGGVRLPTTIKQFDAVVINFGNQIAMQVDIRNAVNIQHLSVIEFPISAVGDSGIHESFDLTHERKVKWFV